MKGENAKLVTIKNILNGTDRSNYVIVVGAF